MPFKQHDSILHAGPLFVKGDSKHEKTYILLLTCATSRAMHLELVSDLSIGGFLRGFKRFMAGRGSPDVIIHDNLCYCKGLSRTLFYTYHSNGMGSTNDLLGQ